MNIVEMIIGIMPLISIARMAIHLQNLIRILCKMRCSIG